MTITDMDKRNEAARLWTELCDADDDTQGEAEHAYYDFTEDTGHIATHYNGEVIRCGIYGHCLHQAPPAVCGRGD